MPEQPKQQGKPNRWINEVLYGIINAIVGAPTMISFAAIVYQVHPSHAAPCDAAGPSVSTRTSGITECPDALHRKDYHIGNPHTTRLPSNGPPIGEPVFLYSGLLGEVSSTQPS